MDELLGILEIGDHLRLRPEMLVIIDTAPTGHALRLLEMPEVAHEWVRVLLRVLLKYRHLVRPGQLAVELLKMSKSIRLLQALLHDPVSTRLVVVTRAAAIPRLETGRLIARLRRLGLPRPMVLVNALTLAAGRCPWCRANEAAEQRELAALARATKRRSPECAIILAPLGSPPPTGVAALEQWAASWSRLPQRRQR
jgi:arsenite-transporting ATPase